MLPPYRCIFPKSEFVEGAGRFAVLRTTVSAVRDREHMRREGRNVQGIDICTLRMKIGV